MRSLGATDLLVLVMFVLLVLDSPAAVTGPRPGRGARDTASGAEIPPGAGADRVGITLRQIQLRRLVDSDDGGVGWDGPEILEAEDDEDDRDEEADEDDRDDRDEEADEGEEADVFAMLTRQLVDLPAPRHCRPTITLEWITNGLSRRPVAMLERATASAPDRLIRPAPGREVGAALPG